MCKVNTDIEGLDTVSRYLREHPGYTAGHLDYGGRGRIIYRRNDSYSVVVHGLRPTEARAVIAAIQTVHAVREEDVSRELSS